jgi:hypothetical protein
VLKYYSTPHALALAFVLSACAGTKHVEFGAADLSGIENELRTAEDSLAQGDRDTAHQHLEEARRLLSAPEIQHEPDRHVLYAKLGALEDRSNGKVRTPAVSSPPFAATPMPAFRAAVEVSPSPSPEPAASRNEAPLDTSNLLSALGQPDNAKAAAPEKADPAAAFKSGPLRDQERAITLLAKGKRTRTNGQRTQIYSQAAAALTSCAEDGAELIKHHPELKHRRFAAGGQQLLGPQIPQFCQKKLRWLMKTGAVRANKLADAR